MSIANFALLRHSYLGPSHGSGVGTIIADLAVVTERYRRARRVVSRDRQDSC